MGPYNDYSLPSVFKMTEDQKENPKLIIAHGLASFFKDEPHKIALWFLVKNTHFGNWSPAELIGIRGEAGIKKIASFILASQERQ